MERGENPASLLQCVLSELLPSIASQLHRHRKLFIHLGSIPSQTGHPSGLTQACRCYRLLVTYKPPVSIPSLPLTNRTFPSAWFAISQSSYSSFRTYPGMFPGHSPQPRLGPRVRALSWLLNTSLQMMSSPTKGHRAPCVLSTATVSAPSTVPSIQPPPTEHPLQARQRFRWGFRERATWSNFCPMRGSHFSGRG